MGLRLDSLTEVQNRDVQSEMTELINKELTTASAPELAKSQTCSVATAFFTHISYECKAIKIINKSVGDLIAYLVSYEGDYDVNRALKEFCQQNQHLPDDIRDKVLKIDQFGGAIDFLKDTIETFTKLIPIVEAQVTEARGVSDALDLIWAEFLTGAPISKEIYHKYLWLRRIIIAYKVDYQLTNSPSQVEGSWGSISKPTQVGGGYAGGDVPDENEEDGSPIPNDDPTGVAPSESYASKARASPSSEESAQPECWADALSSDEEDDLRSMLNRFGSTGIDSKPYIEVPADFEDKFPSVHKAWKVMLDKWGWTIKKADCHFQNEGFIANKYGKATDTERGEILKALGDEKRIALNTFISLLLSVHWHPKDIANGEQASLVSGFVTSLFLKHEYKNNEKKQGLLKVSLKGNDAGESVIRLRVMQCFQTGSKCASVLLTAVMKMLKRLVDTSPNEERKGVLRSASKLCFTSAPGMMQNCLRTVSKKSVENVESINKKGKTTRTRKSVMRPGKDRPHLNAKELELTQKEHESVRAKENSFNKLDEVIEKTLDTIEDPSDPLFTATVVKYVVDLAYDKISAIRHLNKGRRNAIRAKAKELAGDGKDLSTANWLAARKELISSFEEITEDTLATLNWDVESIIKNLKPSSS